jgi:hypothetical protein
MSLEMLEYILKKGETERCVEFFQDMPEAERRTYAKLARTWLEKANKESGVKTETVHGEVRFLRWQESEQLPAASCASLATFTLTEIKREDRKLRFIKPELVYAIFGSRKPEWLTEWAEWYTTDHLFSWPLVRRFVRDKLCQKPTGEAYILSMLVGLCAFHDNTSTIYANLAADPELLKDEIWRLFDVEGDKDRTLAARDKYSRGDNTWTAALLRLSEEKRIPRAKLLDCSLSVLERDFKQFHAGWFSQFHQALKPTPAERVNLQPNYLALLGSRNPPTVSFALEALQIIAKEGKLDAKGVLSAVGPALWSPKKGTVELALRLLDRIATEEGEYRKQALLSTLEAFQHEKADVHKAVLKLLEKHKKSLDPNHFQVMREKCEVVAASQRARLLALLPDEKASSEKRPTAAAETNEKELRDRAAKLDKKWSALVGVDQAVAALRGETSDLAAIHFDPVDIPHLDPDRLVNPINDLDELIDVFSHVLEEPGDPMKVERVLGGVSRLCDQKPADFAIRTGPFAKRAKARMFAGPFVGAGLLPDLCGLAIAWTQGEVPFCERSRERGYTEKQYVAYDFGERSTFIVPANPTVLTFLSQRLLALSQRAATGTALPLLSAPTHSGGWIDPRVLAARTQQLGNGTTDVYDQVLALLRLAPEHRSDTLKKAMTEVSEWGEALRYALGASPPKKIGPSAGLWIAAARSRTPREDDSTMESRHPGFGPDAGKAARYSTSIKEKRNVYGKSVNLRLKIEPIAEQKPTHELVTVLMNGVGAHSRNGWGEFHSSHAAGLRWIATIWPLQKESFFATGSIALSGNLDWWEAQWANKTYLEPLLNPDIPLEPMGLLLLSLGLAAKDPGEHGLATDALIAAIDDGRVDGELLGGVLADLLPSGLVKAARFAKTLGQAARPSPLHGFTVATGIEHSLRGDPSKAPRDLSALLELLRELLAELREPLRDAEARSYLQQFKAGGKTGRLVRELLATDISAPLHIDPSIPVRSLQGRLERAERWQRWAGADEQKGKSRSKAGKDVSTQARLRCLVTWPRPPPSNSHHSASVLRNSLSVLFHFLPLLTSPLHI